MLNIKVCGAFGNKKMKGSNFISGPRRCNSTELTGWLPLIFFICWQVDPLGPLLTLRELLFSDNSIMTVRSFITKYWYSVILAALAVIALMVSARRIGSNI